MSVRALFVIGLLSAGLVLAQEPPAPPPPAETVKGHEFTVEPGTKVPLSLINSISTKHSAPGDRVYLETAFPILANGRIVIPVGSYVSGTVTQVKRPGRAKGRGELYVRFDSLTLPNGVTRDFRARLGGMDATNNGELDKSEGKVRSEGNKGGDMRTIGETAAAGTSVGGIVGSVADHPVMGLGIGAAAGAAAGLIGVLASRGPDAVLSKGSTVEMILDRPLNFTESDLEFGSYQPPRAAPAAPAADTKSNGGILPRRRFPW